MLLTTAISSSAANGAMVSTDVTFSTANQSMWAPGEATANLTGSAFIGPSWEGRSYALWGSIPTATAFAAMQLNPGRLGLEASFQASTGGVAVDYPVELRFAHPDEVRPGETFTRNTSFARNPNPKLDITGFGAEFAVDAVADIRATWGGGYDETDFGINPAVYTGDHGGPSTLPFTDVFNPDNGGVDPFLYDEDVTLFSTGGEQRVRLITIGSGTGVSFEIPGFDVVGVSASVPAPLNQSTMNYEPNGNLKTAATGDSFLSLDLDVIKLASLISQAFSGGAIPPLSADVEFESLSTTISYALLDLALSAGPALHQDFELVFEGLDVALTTSDGQMAMGDMGASFNFVAPHDMSRLEIEAIVSIDQSFISKTGLALQLAMTLDVLKADLEIFGVTIANFGPFFSTSASAKSPPVNIFTPDPFALEGFNTETVDLSVHIVPEPSGGALAALAIAATAARARRRRRRRAWPLREASLTRVNTAA